MKLSLFPLVCLCAVSAQGALDQSLQALANVGREGQGNEAASVAWKEVVQTGPASLPALLAVVGKGSPVADNWLRIAGDAIVQNARAQGQALPVAEVEAFLKDTAHPPPARRLAFDLLKEADPARADAVEPSLATDPVQELRRGAVQRLIDAARTKEADAAKTAYLAALDVVRDEDQTRAIVTELRKQSVPVDLPKHFGFLMQWQVIGPFDNSERKGFETVFPPEKEIRLDATYDGKSGPVKWQPFVSGDEYGKLDFNKPFGMLKEVTAYAVADFQSTEERDAEIRLGCKDGWKVWLNGQFLFGRDEYHRGQQMDQYKLKCHLRKGANTILVKCCQNEQKEQWTVEWEFQLRVCDGAGTAILAAATPAK
ncbi:conserved hypothetical protein [Chthoniobacter flavus Ellin428]|uniref:HEAT repeat domain-containing protein n=1 Tax=Chthoniobacter flavus Ellin428 TaxID=497964 RepID=B4CWY3_9BACT|nr:hypothetical protein [Chthoniobacter flavus]EDY21303.1 conserved hypothetical protein [Chthoniobacter flavus Ellin428]TCO84928.1 hypothetical protein EV701_13348 [Chthoniobacter flavus]